MKSVPGIYGTLHGQKRNGRFDSSASIPDPQMELTVSSVSIEGLNHVNTKEHTSLKI
jgi:hypothetical protein